MTFTFPNPADIMGQDLPQKCEGIWGLGELKTPMQLYWQNLVEKAKM